jgi:hypothetical protein
MVRELSRLSLLVGGALFLVLAGWTTRGEAGVNVTVGADGVQVTVGGDGVQVNVGGEGVSVNTGNMLPLIRFAAAPELVVIPGTYIYIVPDIDAEVLFFQGNWWRPYEGRWYRAEDYNGPWSALESGRVPGGLTVLPLEYRQHQSPGYRRIPHEELRRNWKQWEREKHWDR